MIRIFRLFLIAGLLINVPLTSIASTDSKAPSVVSVFPEANSLDASVSGDITVTFDMDMDSSTINEKTFVISTWSGGFLNGIVSYNIETRTAHFRPPGMFESGETVTIVVTDAVSSLSGATLAAEQSWSFTVISYEGVPADVPTHRSNGDDSALADDPIYPCCLNNFTIDAHCTMNQMTSDSCRSIDGRSVQDCSLCIYGACCDWYFPDTNLYVQCEGHVESSCNSIGGTFHAGVECNESGCLDGACCQGEGCVISTYRDCLGGWLGIHTTCEDAPCSGEPTGACCKDGVCSEGTNSDCIAAGGVYQGDDTNCAQYSCTTTPPDPPALDTVMDAGTGTDLILKWTHSNPEPVSGYEIYVGTSEDNYEKVGMVPESGTGINSFVVGNLEEHVDYWIMIQAFNASGGSPYEEWHEPVNPSIPVFLVHGLGDQPSTWDPMKIALEAQGFNHVYAVDKINPCGANDSRFFDNNALMLTKFIDSVTDTIKQITNISVDDIDIVGHSMGGLIARRYLSPMSAYPRKNVRNLIMLGSPNLGSKLANYPGWLQSLATECPPNSPALDELKPREMKRYNALFPNNPDVFYYSLWGTAGGQLSCLWSFGGPIIGQGILSLPNDGIVTKKSAIGDFNWQVMFPHHDNGVWCHTRPNSYVSSSDAQSYIINALRGWEVPPEAPENVDIYPDTSFQQVYETISEMNQGEIATDSFFVEQNSVLGVIFTSIDSMMSFYIESPSSVIYDSTTYTIDSTEIYFTDSINIRAYSIQSAESGWWHWFADASSAETPVIEYAVLASCVNDVVLFESQSLDHVSPGDTLALQIEVHDNGVGLTGLTVESLRIWNDMDTSTVYLLDDGNSGDELPNDGIYSLSQASFSDTGLVEYRANVSGISSIGQINRLVTFHAYVQEVSLSCCGLYAGGQTGNTNCDTGGLRDLADITRLIDNVYISKLELCCVENGNVNGDAGDLINLADITKLIDHVYITKAPTAGCE